MPYEHTHIHAHTQREKAIYDGGREWSDAAANHGTPSTAGHHQKLRRNKERSSSEPSEKAWLCGHLNFALLASRTGGE